jgi:hypothetical protein
MFRLPNRGRDESNAQQQHHNHRLPMARAAQGPTAEEHRVGLLRPVDLGWHVRAHPSRTLCWRYASRRDGARQRRRAGGEAVILSKGRLSGQTRRADLIWLSSRDDPVSPVSGRRSRPCDGPTSANKARQGSARIRAETSTPCRTGQCKVGVSEGASSSCAVGDSHLLFMGISPSAQT